MVVLQHSLCHQMLGQDQVLLGRIRNKDLESICAFVSQTLIYDLDLEVFQFLSCFSSPFTNWRHLGLWRVLHFSFGPLRGRLLGKLFCERNKLRGAREILSEWFWNVESLSYN